MTDRERRAFRIKVIAECLETLDTYKDTVIEDFGEEDSATCVLKQAMQEVSKLMRVHVEPRDREEDITVSCSTDGVIVALMRRLRQPGARVQGPLSISFTVNELARAEQVHLDRRADGHRLELRVLGDT